MAGYHLADIPKGVVGEPSKIREELLEFEDVVAQSNKLMALQELSDMVGAIDAYLYRNYGDHIHIDDLIKMAAATCRAFESGHRK